MKNIFSFLIGLSLATTIGCRDDGDTSKTSDAGNDVSVDAASGTATTIYKVQDTTTVEGTAVLLRSVIVTSIDTFGDRTGNITVQEKKGGAFSGVVLRKPVLPMGLAIGDIVDVEGGVKSEFIYKDKQGNPFPNENSITQIEATDSGALQVTKTGSGVLPAAELLKPWDISDNDIESRKWEWVLIKFEGVRALGAIRKGKKIGDESFRVTGPYQIGGEFISLDGMISPDDCFSSITGVVSYFYNFRVQPTSATDLVKDEKGDSCLPLEITSETCGDTLDNDHNGFIDCLDNSCQGVVDSCTTVATVITIQDESVGTGRKVSLKDVVVTAVSSDKKSFWVKDAGDAAAYNGVKVYNKTEVPVELVAGSTISFDAKITERYDVTQLQNLESLTILETEMVVVKILENIFLADLASMEQYEGVLIKINPGIIDTASDESCTKNCTFTISNGDTPFYIYDDISRETAVKGECYSSIVGVMDYDSYRNADRRVLQVLKDGLKDKDGLGCQR